MPKAANKTGPEAGKDTEAGPAVHPQREAAEPSFEDSIKRLGAIVSRLESGELPLEDSLKLFEEGIGLARASQARLDAAERRVEELLGIGDDGSPIVREIDEE
jgi:exodeoxyribonuclease VII small subunit